MGSQVFNHLLDFCVCSGCASCHHRLNYTGPARFVVVLRGHNVQWVAAPHIRLTTSFPLPFGSANTDFRLPADLELTWDAAAAGGLTKFVVCSVCLAFPCGKLNAIRLSSGVAPKYPPPAIQQRLPHHQPVWEEKNGQDHNCFLPTAGAPSSAPFVPNSIGTELAPADFASLEARWIDRELAVAAQLRRVDSLTDAEPVGRKGGDYSGIAIPYFLPCATAVRDYRLRRDHPEMEIDSPGRVKPKQKYLSPARPRQHALLRTGYN